MALIIRLRCVEKLVGKADRSVKLIFRGHPYESKTIPSAKNAVYFGESFEWPIARPAEADETIELQVINRNKYVPNKLVGRYVMLMQSLVDCGEMKLCEPLVDDNNQILQSHVTFEVQYLSPDGNIGVWSDDEFDYPIPGSSESFAGEGNVSYDELGYLDDNDGSLGNDQDDTDRRPRRTSIAWSEDVEGGGRKSSRRSSMQWSQRVLSEEKKKKSKKGKPDFRVHELYKARDVQRRHYKVCITIVEAQQLVGLDIDPVIRVEVGDSMKYTSIKKSTNAPYYNDYFVFDFHESQAMIFDKMITLTAMHSINIPGRQVLKVGNVLAGRTIGQFKCDVGTIYANPDHQFYHRWAVLLDPMDIGEGPRGYIKCDIAVIGRGDNLKTTKVLTEEESNNIEENLLLPVGVPVDRQSATYTVVIYRGEDVPQTDVGLVASMRKAMSIGSSDMVDAFVSVSFVGNVGKTSVKQSCNPYWGEVLTFVDMFPPLCNRIRLQLCDHDAMSDDVIATHFIELAQIMDPGGDDEGILPTFGPSWINLYGSPRSFNATTHQNEGLMEGAAYRGRLLISVTTALLDEDSGGPASVKRELLHSSAKIEVAPKREFLLFASLFGCCMIDKKYKGKKIYFEISHGNYGNTLDGNPSTPGNGKGQGNDDHDDGNDDDDDETALLENMKEGDLPCFSTTVPEVPSTEEKNLYYIDIRERKPCFYVVSVFEDLRKRLYNSNMIARLSETLDAGLEDVRQLLLQTQDEEASTKLIEVMEEFIPSCISYITNTELLGIGAGAGKTKLDHFRLRSYRFRIERMKTVAAKIASTVNEGNIDGKFYQAKTIGRRLRHMIKEPQDSLPDVFIWMIADKKRVAYHRIQARDLIHSAMPEYQGAGCGKFKTIFLKVPEKTISGKISSTEGVSQAKLVMYLWLGLNDPAKGQDYMSGLPKGLKAITEVTSDGNTMPPSAIIYEEKNTFHFRAYISQARNLIGSDDSGLSDPYARVTVTTQCKSTEWKEQTLSPNWNETLDFHKVDLYGPASTFKTDPPVIMVEIFDHDFVGKSEVLGRAMVFPKVKLLEDEYGPPDFPPKLQWWPINKGKTKAGELLGAFEALQVADGEDLTPLTAPKDLRAKQPIYPLPPLIKPPESWFRIEILFWGLRDMKKLHLMSVDRPKMYASCAGKMIESRRLVNVDKNANFDEPVQYMDVRLPDNMDFWPPVVIRCLNQRRFIGETLVGSCSINGKRYIYVPEKERKKKEIQKHRELQEAQQEENPTEIVENGSAGDPFDDPNSTVVSQDDPHGFPDDRLTNGAVRGDPVVINIDEVDNAAMPDVQIVDPNGQPVVDPNGQPVVDPNGQPVVDPNGHPIVDISGQPVIGPDGKPVMAHTERFKQAEDPESIQKRREAIAGFDWWSKYYVTMDDMSKIKTKRSYKARLSSESGGWSSESSSSSSSSNEADEPDTPNNPEEVIQTVKKKKRKRSIIKRKRKKAKKRMKAMLGHVNKAFKNDDDELIFADEKAPEDNSFICRLKIYQTELELVPEFDGFEELIQTHDLYRGKKGDDEDDDMQRVVGKFKGALCIYKLDDDESASLEGMFAGGEVVSALASQIVAMGGDENLPMKAVAALRRHPKLKLPRVVPKMQRVDVHVMVYVVKADNLPPMDLNGKADPYLIVKLGKQEVNDKELRQYNQLNPIFGRVYEFDFTFPMTCYLQIQIMDYDRLSADDLIGETIIDLENRFLSEHRATCGISQQYDLCNYNVWRDPMKPTEILAKLCKENQMEQPDYGEKSVQIDGRIYFADDRVETADGDLLPTNEHLALEVLKNWGDLQGSPLVPEHVESRPLYNPARPGIEQGKLEMWIDMFPKDAGMPSVTVDISPRQPRGYELQCVVWNTDDVILDDKNALTGEQSSDIMVKGYLYGPGDDGQATDIHYRSLTGEGNFNWRFLFPFDYLKAEEMMISKTKAGIFDMSGTEVKTPPRLTIQIWDADLVSADDFLGSVVLDLNRVSRPAKEAKKCVLRRPAIDGPAPTLSLFKNERCRGWWPMVARAKDSDGDRLVGKVELELQLMAIDVAEKNPAGAGREAPNPLPEPNRPDTAFLWFMNPMKTLRFIIWKNFKWRILKALLFIVIVIFIGLFLYNLPGATVNKIWSIF